LTGADGGGTHRDDAPYLDLAREIQLEVARVVADGATGAEALEAAFDGITRRERQRVAKEVFAGLPAEQQWVVLERVFDDEELAEALSGERAARLAAAGRRALATQLVAGDRLDTRALPAGERLTLGLFREAEVDAGVRLGRAAASTARQLGLVATDQPGTFRVIEDVFNPGGGYFVTADYDEATWRTADRLAAHALVRVGALAPDEPVTLEPVLHLGGRVDVETDGDGRVGLLHLGYALVGDVEVFSASRKR
jgi:hypothetical protein